MSNVPRLTKEQAAIIGLYTGISCGEFSDIHAKAEQLLGRSIFTHEFAHEPLCETLKDRVKSEFIAICYQDADR